MRPKRTPRTALLAAVLSCYSACLVQAQQIKISTITGGGQPSEETIKLLRQKLSEHEKLFTLVKTEDASPGLIIQADCMDRKTSDAAYICFYTVHYASGTTKSFMGGGVNVTKTADEMATGFLASLAQDISESMNNTIRTDARAQLESCLLLTQSSCAVPEILVPELKVKILNLSQYLQKKAASKAT
jgi:hypothetical protein